ncbi:MAG: serine/threonine protein kinase [Deltaproteobacteria bacterium]|nr:serine/threonine protein kinase [Deltaproteobacteria bacterium]
MASSKDSSTGGPAFSVARALASPIGVLITIPLLVITVGVGILLVGRDATHGASQSMARRQLAEQAIAIQTDITFALDQAGPLLERLRVLADPTRSADDVLVRMADLIVGRPGVSYASISFTDGTFRGAYLGEQRRLEVQESKITDQGTNVERFTIDGSKLTKFRTETSDYDPRRRGFYQLAERVGARAWTEPYTFFRSFETGITCSEPVYSPSPPGPDKRLLAVLTVDFDVGALSSYVARPALDEARSVVFTRDGIILAYPSADKLALPTGDKLLRHEDFREPALTSLFKSIAQDGGALDRLQFLELDASDGAYLTSVAPIGGKRAGVTVPLDWFVATVVPERTLLGPTHALERSSVFASAGALAIAVAIALILAWNLVRMRRQVAASRAEARSAEQRAKELGSYRLVAKLGAGGMGEVWRAEHRLLARSAAIKLIRPEALTDPESVAEIRERFRREAQTLASMRCRHTIAIFDYGVTEAGVFYYVMELLDGLDMESLVVREGGQPAARVIKMMTQACASLAEAHDAGLFHRDIKPPNLFVSRAADEVDVIKLLDFGIVQTINELPAPQRTNVLTREQLLSSMSSSKLTQMGAMLGTPGFMAPEQILGMQLDGRADLYALGCCMWWLLTGGEVFEREGADAKILHKHIYDPVPDLAAAMQSWCPPQLDAVMKAVLAKDPDDRPRDARHLAAMLRAIPIPAEHAWTDAKAQAWWASYKPGAAETSVSPSEIQVIMPGATG